MFMCPYGTLRLEAQLKVSVEAFRVLTSTVLLPTNSLKLLSSQADKLHNMIHSNDLRVLDIVGGLHL